MELTTPQKISDDRDGFIDELIEMIKNHSQEPMNGDFVDSLARLPDDALLRIHAQYQKISKEVSKRQRMTTDMAHRRPG